MSHCDVCLRDEDELDGLTCSECSPDAISQEEKAVLEAAEKWANEFKPDDWSWDRFLESECKSPVSATDHALIAVAKMLRARETKP